MKVTLPEDRSEITLGQYIKYIDILKDEVSTDEEKEKRIISLFSNIQYHKIDNVFNVDYNKLTNIIQTSLNKEAKFIYRFDLNGVKYGFINDFDSLTTGEFTTLMKYQTEGEDDDFINVKDYFVNYKKIPNLMAVLFREIISEDKHGNYLISDFDDTFKRSDIFKEMPMHIVDGALVFFLNLQIELKNYIQKYTEEALLREQKRQNILKNGGGIRRFINFAKGIF